MFQGDLLMFHRSVDVSGGMEACLIVLGAAGLMI